LSLGRSENTKIEEFLELLQRSVVHPVDLSHFDDTEVKHSTSGGDWSEHFSLLVNFNSLVLGFEKLFIYLLGFGLNGGKHINQLSVIKKGSLGISKSFQKLGLIGLKGLGVHCDLLLQLGKLFLKRLLLHGDKSSEQLLLKTSLSDSEINDCGLGCKFWREMRVGES
jgi:hypothetical protein